MKRIRAFLSCLLLVIAARSAAADPGETARDRALEVFRKGVAELEAGDTSQALESFERSRALYATWQNTLNCAISLTRLGREAEAATRLEQVLEFDDLPDARRRSISDELERLLARLGSLSLSVSPSDSTVTVGARTLAADALSRPLRLSPGTYSVRVFKSAFEPEVHEVVVEAGGMEALEVRLSRLATVAELKVEETGGRRLAVYLDGMRIGVTPWAGLVAPGAHSVQLRGPSGLGTAPELVRLEGGREKMLRVQAVRTRCRAELSTSPATAELVLDGVPLGRGAWSGPLPCRSYVLEARAVDHLALRRTLSLREGAANAHALELRRADVLVIASRWELGITASGLLAPEWGGDAESTCQGRCERSIPIGGQLAVTGMLRLPNGVGLGLDLSASRITASLAERDPGPDLVRDGPSPTSALLDDDTTLYAAGFGPKLSLATGSNWIWEGALGAGIWVGLMRLERRGTVTDAAIPLTPRALHTSAIHAYLKPELLASRRLGSWDVGLSVGLLLLFALRTPDTDGFTQTAQPVSVSYETETLMGSFVWMAQPGVFARHRF